jgi:hypothetical protein
MPSVFRVYSTPFVITKAQSGFIDPYLVRNISASWFNSAGIRTTKGSPQATATQVMRMQDIIYKDLVSIAGKLRYLENSLNRAYGRNRAGLNRAVLAGTPSYNQIGLTFNGSTYKSLYNYYLTLMDAVAFTGLILRSWTRSTLY